MFKYTTHDLIILPIMLIAFIGIGIGLKFLLKTEKQKQIPFKIIAILIPLLEIAKQIYFFANNIYTTYQLPLHFCSLFILLFPLSHLFGKKCNKIFKPMSFCFSVLVTFLIYIHPYSTIGNSTSTYFQSFLSFHTFSFHHLIILYFILTVILNDYKPKLKDCFLNASLVLFYASYGIPCAFIFNSNYIGILNSHIPFLETFRQKYGYVPYLIVQFLAIILIAVAVTILYYFIRKSIDKRKDKKYTKNITKQGELLVAPKIFGIEHIIYLAITLILTIAGLILIKKFCKTEKAKLLTIKISGLILLITILINRYACMTTWKGEPFLPSSLSGLCSIVFGVLLLVCKKDSKPLHFITYTALVSALISTVYPTYIGQGASFGSNSLFFFPTITSLLHHSISVFCAILMFVTGFVKPDIKKWHVWPLGYCTFITYGLFMIKIMKKGDAMNINSPLLSGTIFNWFYMGLIFLGIYTVFLIVYDVIKNKSNCLFCEWNRKLKAKFKKKEAKLEEEK